MFWLLPLITAFAAQATAMTPTGTVRVAPHDQYSSTIGVHGCKINVNRIAYWPFWPDYSGMCIKVKFGSRSRTVLHVDVSGSAHDISFDTFRYLAYGTSATSSPALLSSSNDGGIDVDYEVVDMAQCADIITSGTGKLSIMALSPNQVNKCVAEGNNWLAQNFELRNINDPLCQRGVDEVCTFDTVTGTSKCPSTVGAKQDLLSPAQPVIDLTYPCGVEKVGGSGSPIPKQCPTVVKLPDPSA